MLLPFTFFKGSSGPKSKLHLNVLQTAESSRTDSFSCAYWAVNRWLQGLIGGSQIQSSTDPLTQQPCLSRKSFPDLPIRLNAGKTPSLMQALESAFPPDHRPSSPPTLQPGDTSPIGLTDTESRLPALGHKTRLSTFVYS